MGERVFLKSVNVVWDLLKKEIGDKTCSYAWLQQATPEQWMKQIERYTSLEWDSKKKHVVFEKYSYSGIEELTMKNRASFREFVSRLSKALSGKRVEWQATCTVKESSGDGTDCVIRINTSGAPPVIGVTIETVGRKRGFPCASKGEKEEPKKAKCTVLDVKQVKQINDELDRMNREMETPPILDGRQAWGKKNDKILICMGGGKANDGFSQILPKTRMKKKMMMKTSSIL